MAEAFHADVAQADTERTTLVDIAAGNVAAVYYKLLYPRPYRSVRTVNGHRIVVVVEDAEDFAERLRRYTQEAEYLEPKTPLGELTSDRSTDA